MVPMMVALFVLGLLTGTNSYTTLTDATASFVAPISREHSAGLLHIKVDFFLPLSPADLNIFRTNSTFVFLQTHFLCTVSNNTK